MDKEPSTNGHFCKSNGFIMDKTNMYRIRSRQKMRYLFGELGFNLNLSCTQVEQTSTDTYRIPTGYRTQEDTNAHVTFIHRHLYPVASNQNFEHVQNLPIGKAGHNQISPDMKPIRCMRKRQKCMRTDTNRQRILLSVSIPLALSGKV